MEMLPCSTKVDAIFNSPTAGIILILINSNDLWSYDIVRDDWRQVSLTNLYPRLVGGFEGGAECSTGTKWFFKQNKIWAFDGYTLKQQFPIEIEPVFWSQQSTTPTVLVNKNNKIYILKDSVAYEFCTIQLRIINRYHLTFIFNNLPSTVHTSYKINGLIYFFDDQK
jgi:hypothetical protein